MTSDAKIGLLLGLVFIFIIAFVINGLPRFRSAVRSADATQIMNVGEENIGIAAREHRAQDTIDTARWQSGQIQEQQTAFHSNDNTADGSDNTTLPPEGISHQGSSEDMASGNPSSSLPESFYFPGRTRYQMPFTGNPFMAEPTSPSSTSSDDNNRETRSERVDTPVVPVTPAVQDVPSQQRTVAPAGPNVQNTTYVVQDGDNLSKIAKKFYGPEEGNKIANVTLIFEANRDVMKSIDDVRSGKKIVIPSLPAATTTGTNNPSAIFQNPQFMRVGSIGGVPDTGRWYVVKDNDSLWNISAEHLSKGSRYTEIIKLNTDKLSEDNNYKLIPGMQLRLPAQ